jgi:hypothetical protein
MRLATYGLAALFGLTIAGGALAQGDAIQETEEPGSEIEIEAGDDGVEIGREKDLEGAPMENEGTTPLQPLDDPDAPVDPDPVDAELPGEGPEDLSGPGDEDPLPE